MKDEEGYKNRNWNQLYHAISGLARSQDKYLFWLRILDSLHGIVLSI
jgi:hypothetical protein